jgi:hypothetical protein
MYKILTDGAFDIADLETLATFDGGASFRAFRPPRIDFFVEYRPAAAGVPVPRPHACFSAPVIFGCGIVCFNAGLEGNTITMLGFSMGTGYGEHQWKHSPDFPANFRAIGLNTRLVLWGSDIINSLKAGSFGAEPGILLGF